MSDSNEKKSLSGVLENLEKTPFFTFSKPYLDFIGKGTMFSLVYYLMAIVSILVPFAFIIWAIQEGIFDYASYMGAGIIVWFIITWFFAAFAGWIGFQLWWARKSQVTEVKESEFVAIPICADIFRTFGEWLGTLIAVIGFGGGLFGLILANEFLSTVPGGSALVIAGPVVGFFTILFFRLVAEGIKIFVSIANSCRDIAKK